jgi:hypothetical protein
MPSLQNSNAGPISNLTWREAARRVARSVGGMTNPAVILAAMDAISEAIQDWNTEKDWRFLQIVAPTIEMDGSTNRWPLPSNFKKPYDAYIEGATTTLQYVEARHADTLLPGGGAFPVTAYSLYNVGTTGEIETLPGAIAGNLVVRYYRPMVEFDSEDAFLDLPSRYVPGILAAARALMCLEAKDFSGSDRWAAYATKRLAWAKRDDDRIPDEEIRFSPAIASVPVAAVDFEDLTA